MTPFMPLLFTAHSGVVHFQGRPLSDFTAMRVKVALRCAALDAPPQSRLEAVFALAKEQVEAAQSEARKQQTRAA